MKHIPSGQTLEGALQEVVRQLTQRPHCGRHILAGEEHGPGADEDGVAFGVEIPIALFLAAHQDVEANCFAWFKIAEPRLNVAARLLDQRAHGQAVDEPAGPLVAIVAGMLAEDAVPQPGHHHACGFAESGGADKRNRKILRRGDRRAADGWLPARPGIRSSRLPEAACRRCRRRFAQPRSQPDHASRRWKNNRNRNRNRDRYRNRSHMALGHEKLDGN